MQRKVMLIGLIVMILLFAFIGQTFAEAVVVKAQTDKDVYKVGDIVTVKVTMEKNTGLHSLFFDLTYEGTVLKFESITPGGMVNGELRKHDFLYAASDPATSNTRGSHVIVSYALQGTGVISPRTGVLCEIRFRVLTPGNPNIRYQFTYNNNAVTDGEGNKLSDVLWKNSNGFTIGSSMANAFILITKPTEMQVVYAEQVEMEAVSSTGSDYYVNFANLTSGYVSEKTAVGATNLPKKSIALKYGYNNLMATLYQRVNNQDFIIATDTVRVYRPEAGQYIKIESPKDHQLLNTDMVDVIISSAYEPVMVNGLPAEFYENGNGNNKLYRARLWLKNGFNTITAETTGPENVKYNDTIQVYYQKDSSIFGFVLPQAGEYFKPAAGSYLRIEGEIDSPYRSGVTMVDGTPAPNTVTLKVVFRPSNKLKENLFLVNDKPAKIGESSAGIDARSRYKFYNDFEIPLEGLGSGEVEIIAYKNKDGSHWDDEIHRIVYLDDNRLWIDLVQPNVYTHDLLDTYQRLKNFNETKDPQMTNTLVTEEGGFVLADGEPSVEKEGILANTADLAEEKNGTLYALTNSSNGNLSIYKKGLGDQSWVRVLTRPQMYGYALCMSDIGLLVGVSNLYSTEESGLYLLKDKALVNIRFPVTLQHVQFIEERNGLINIYGNYYNYLYSFDINTLTESSNGLMVAALNRISFPNNYNLKQFVLSSDGITAVLRTESGQVIFYNKTEAGYLEATIPGTDGNPIRGLSFKNIIAGEYSNGDYNDYLLILDQTNVINIMEYKKGSRRYFASGITFNEPLCAAGFNDNSFLLLYAGNGSYQLKKGQIYFSSFYQSDEPITYLFPEALNANLTPARFFITSKAELYLGAGIGLTDNLKTTSLYYLYQKLDQSAGTLSFNYVNDDMEGLTGLSFEVDPLWLVSNSTVEPIEFGFTVKEKDSGAAGTSENDQIIFKKSLKILSQMFLEAENEFYTLTRQYNPLTDREVIHFEFKNIQEGRYLGFQFKLRPVGNTSPAVYNFKVYKKVHARVCAGNDQKIVVPIHGYVYDRTVDEVTVQQAKIPLGNDRAFNYNYEIFSSQQLVPVEISCINSTGATASLNFTVEIVNSENGLGAIQYLQGENNNTFPGNTLEVTSEKLTLSGKYYGLEGAVVGYEIYGYQYKNGVESVALVKRGLFDTVRDDSVFQDLEVDRIKLGSGYCAGYFQEQEITLIPGKQQLRIYVENPGGLRSEFKVNDKYPDINYSMLPEDQKIVFDLELLTPVVTVQTAPIRYRANLEAYEELESTSQGNRYVFKRSYELNGEIKSLYNFSNLIVKSFTSGLTFEDGSIETSVKVETGNRFKIKVNIVISENVAAKDFDIGVFPTIPSLSNLKTGVRLSVNKNFKDTNFIPDFSRIHPENWSTGEKESREVPIRVKFNRSDLPAPEAWLSLTVNSGNPINGYLEAADGTYYLLKDENHQLLLLPNLKVGRNRIQWVLWYRSIDGRNSYVMSSSNTDKIGMNDDIFDYTETIQTVATKISFNPDMTTRYYSSTLPELNITKDQKTKIMVILNGLIIKEDPGEATTFIKLALTGNNALREGKNELTVTFTESLQQPVSKTYSFLYDSKNPEVVITSWHFAADDRTLEELTALVTDANFDKAYLYYGNDIISRYPKVSIVAADKYLLHWTNLAVNEMDPAAKPITVRAYDHSDKEGTSDTLKSIPQRPGEENIKDTQISLPIYNIDNGYPVLENEGNYKANPFPEHTKFAPRNFLERESAKTIIGNSGDYLVKNINEPASSGSTVVTNGWVGGSPKREPGVYLYNGANYDGGYFYISNSRSLSDFDDYTFNDGNRFNNNVRAILIIGNYTIRFWTEDYYDSIYGSTSKSISDLDDVILEGYSGWANNIESAIVTSNYTTTPQTPQINITRNKDLYTITWQPVNVSIGIWAYELQSQINNSGTWNREAYLYPGVTSFTKDATTVNSIQYRLRVMDTNHNYSAWATSDIYEHFSNQFLIPDEYKYLVFKVAKDFMVIQSKDNITDKIRFRAAGSYKKIADNIIEEVNPTILTLTHTHTIESYNYIYYMVEIPELKNEFVKYCQSIATTLISTPEYAVYDWGSLQVLYDNPLNSDRLVDIYATGNLPGTLDSNQETQLNDLVFYDFNYEEPGSAGILNSSLDYSADQVKVSFDRPSPALTSTINFWLRLEDEGLGDSDYLSELQTISKRVLTIADASDNNLIGIEYQGNRLTFNDISNSIFKSQIGTLNTLLDSQSWNLITLRITDTPTIELFINNKLCLQYPITSDMAAKLLAKEVKLIFGPELGYNYNTGFYSIAAPFYIDRLLTPDEAQRLYSLYDKYSAADLNYYFQNINDEFGTKCGKLRTISGCGSDFFSVKENSNPLEDPSKGSLKASNRMLNLLKKDTNSSGKQYVILSEANTYVAVSIDLESSDDSFTLKPSGRTKLGRYYFGDKNSNYSLGVDRWYSLAGSVLEIDEKTTARLVLRINEHEQSWQLRKGRFHFIYDNTLSKLTPSQVKLYIETDGPVTLGTDMSFNQGNFILKKSLSRTALKTQYSFGLAGMVSLRYKPLNVNRNGLVNYQDAVIFDSELFKIYTVFDQNNDDALFAVDIREEQDTKTIVTNVKVRDGWQHLQLAYDFKESSNKAVYFYIDGTLAGVETVSLQPFGSLAGIQPTGDNVWFGCDQAEQKFACGYIDEVKLSKYYQQSNYTAQEPARLNYLAEAKMVTRDLADNLTIESEKYTLEALDNSLKREGETFPVNLDGIPAGRYRFTDEMVINGHNYRKILFFNIDNRPRFILKEKTPIVFKNVASDLRFTFNSDVSYRFGDERLFYLGLAGEITYKVGEQLLTQTRYLVQDFLNQQTSQWLLGIPEGEIINWQPVNTDNAGLLELVFPNIATAKSVDCRFKYFYFETSFTDTEKFDESSIPELTCRIPLAVLSQPIVPEKDQAGNEYKLVVDVTDGEGGGWDPIFKDIEIAYETISNKNGIRKQGSCGLSQSGSNSGKAELYYDDILSWTGNVPIYDGYNCKLSLKYQGVTYMETNGIQLNWGRKTEEIPMPTIQVLEINEFSLLSIDQQNPEKPKASFYLKYTQNGLGVITPKLEIIRDDRIQEVDTYLTNINTESAVILNKVSIPKGLFKVRLSLIAEGFIRSRELEINNSVEKPEIALTSGVDALIQYNNVLFSWKGYYKGQFIDSIEYQYNLDNHGWTTPNSGWRSVRFYNLEEGYHTFQVQALYHGLPSEIRQVTFFVDINKPKFDASKIKIEKVYDEQGVFYAVKLSGSTGAVDDISLEQLTINRNKVQLQDDGSFAANNVPITADGSENIILTAYDRAGNYTDYQLTIDNPITEILFPAGSQRVRYSPLCLTGKINSQIQAGLSIYVADKFSTTKGDYSGWKKAKINPDRTFFVEDLYINPGTAEREIVTKLRLAAVFDSGKTFEREIELRANEVLRPIEMKLSTHAAEGENSETQISIDCRANVSNISSWSIDFNGDGIYDLVDLTKNPASQEARVHSWTHKYSSLGLVSPRVRVITTDGDFFSTSDTLIIHEKIKEASFKIVNSPIAISTVRMIDESNRVMVMHKQDEQYLVDVYEVRRNDAYLSNKLYEIDLSALGIENPVKIRNRGNTDELFVAANNDALGAIYQLKANQFGNYQIAAVIHLDDEVADFTIQGQTLMISQNNRRNLVKALLVNGVIDQQKVTTVDITLSNSIPLREKAYLETNGANLLMADTLNQRIIQLSPSLGMIDQFGSRGIGEAQFIWPGLIRFHQNRIFINDSGRRDIQVFDRNYSPICTLAYRNETNYYNYVEPEFFADIADFEVIAREEENRLYYYALILSRSVGKLSMIRLPQWEELKVRVRNNKIVFVKEGEIFTAKPDGSDLEKVLSSDSLPRIEGAIDYPALASDGRRLAFTSKIRLYNGQTGSTPEDGVYTYSNLYYVNLEDHKLTKVDLGTMNGYEIERPVFNSNGSKLVFSAKSNKGKWKIYTYNFETGLIIKLFDIDENARFPYYSPDDRYLIFTSDFDGDEEIQIVRVDNLSVRLAVTKNNCRDSFPVWSTVYPGEITNLDLQKLIKSKIAFVSERNSHKGVYCVYLNQENENSISIYDLKNKQVVGNTPDVAAMEVTTTGLEGDYPCFTGDGRSLLFEYFDGRLDQLKKLDFETSLEALIQNQARTYLDLELVQGATRPAGMKNMITNFKAGTYNGNEIKLSWSRYTENDISYIIQYKVANSEDLYEVESMNQDNTIVTGLKMGMDYIVRVFIVENDIEVATSYWVKVKMPEVVARPSFTIDPDNPYLVRLHAWKPDPAENYKWRFSWVVENNEIQVQNSQDYMYEFGTSGNKTIFLKAYTEGQTATSVSDPMKVHIIGDLKPVINHTLAEDSSYIDLSALKSLGSKVNLASAQWIISGPGREPLTTSGSAEVTVQLDGFQHKINVSLTLQNTAINNQSDVAQVNKTIDLDIKEVKPVITYEVAEENQRLVRFSGEYSQGNINWKGAKWSLFANGGLLYSVDGTTTFDYLFPETNQETIYTVSLTVPRRNDGKTVTASQVITVKALPIEPKINYQVLELKQGNDVIGAKLLLDCTESKGNGIDYISARWAVAAASNYGDQAVQVGPTAIYNLVGLNEEQVFEVALTLSRKNGTDPITVTQLINISKNEVPQGKLVVNKTLDDSTNGKVLTLDVFKSTGPNIDWERTEWVIDGQYSQRGPVIRKEIPAVSNDTIVSFTCNLYRFGTSKPETISDKVKVGKNSIYPVISPIRISGTQHRMYKLSVLDTPGVNIDWERTDWYIYDGGERAVQLKGSVVGYEFPFNSEQMGYPVLVEMYLKGSSQPFVAYTTIDVDGDKLTPIITTEVDPENKNLITFKATGSEGSNINWAQTKWTFGDSKEAQYGPIVTYQYPVKQKSTTYKVTLTLTRTSANGVQEIMTATKDVKIGPDQIRPVIKVTKNGDYLVLSAEDSLGKGLLLDRCAWLFDGKGDQESSSLNTQSGVLKSSSYNQSNTNSREISAGGGKFFASAKIADSSTGSTGWNLTDYNNLKSQTTNFSSENSHVGAVCRRYVGGKQNVIVTLFVYRMTPEGGVEGESITVNLNVYNASGVYGR